MNTNKYKPLPILLDRLAQSLAEQGYTPKRTQLLKATASALGYRNTNELTAAADEGALDIAPATPVGQLTVSQTTLTIMRDVLSGALFGVEADKVQRALEGKRANAVVVTPYGNLAMMTAQAMQAPALNVDTGDVTVHTGTIEHKHGTNDYVGASRSDLIRQMAEYVRENWFEVNEFANGFDPDNADDEDLVSEYFELAQNHGIEEYYSTSVTTMKQAGAAAPAPIATVPEYRLEHEMDDEPILIVRIYDGREIARVTRTSRPQDDIAIAEQMLRALNAGVTWQVAPMTIEADAERLLQIADDLESGASADIWYDAHEYGSDEEEDPDRAAENQIETAQTAMSDAAEVLRQIANRQTNTMAHEGAAALVVSNQGHASLEQRQEEDPVWITDVEGFETGNVTAGEVLDLGLEVYMDRDSALPLTEDEYAMLDKGNTHNGESEFAFSTGGSVLYRGRKYMAPDIDLDFDDARDDEREAALAKMTAYCEEKKADIEALGGHILCYPDATDGVHNISILIPFEEAQAQSPDDWSAALAWLLLPSAEREDGGYRITVIPQLEDGEEKLDAPKDEWITWDATFDALRLGWHVRDTADKNEAGKKMLLLESKLLPAEAEAIRYKRNYRIEVENRID